jgi:hypothetical protein
MKPLILYGKFLIFFLYIGLLNYVINFSTEFENKMHNKLNISFMKSNKIQTNIAYLHTDTKFNINDKLSKTSYNINKNLSRNLNENTNKNLNNNNNNNQINKDNTDNVDDGCNNKNQNNQMFKMSHMNQINDFLESDSYENYLKEGKIYASAWIKYFKFRTTNEVNIRSSLKAPRSFIVNGEFKEQAKLYPNAYLNGKLDNEINKSHIYIKDKFSFYAVVFKDKLNILGSRQVILMTF